MFDFVSIKTINIDSNSTDDEDNVVLSEVLHCKFTGLSTSIPKKNTSKSSKKPRTEKMSATEELYNKLFGDVNSERSNEIDC